MRTTLLRSTALALALAALPGLGGAAMAQAPDKNPELADPLEDAAEPSAGTGAAEPAATQSPAPAPAPAPVPPAPVPPATAEAEADPGAQAIRDALAPYISQTLLDERVVTVARDGEGYRISVDAAPLVARIAPEMGKLDVSPYSMLVSERADGTWDVAANDPMRISAAFEVEGQRSTIDYDIPESTFTGVWSPSLGTFTSGQGRASGATIRQTDPQSTSDATVGPLDYTMTARATGVGEADMDVEQRMDGMRQRIESKGDPAVSIPSMTIDMDMGRIDVGTTGTAVRARAMMDLWAFLVPRVDGTGERIKADQEELRSRLRALLPLWRNLAATYEVRDFKVTTPFGEGSAGTAGQTMSFDGISHGGSYTWRFDLDGLSVNSPHLPDWAGGLLPEDMRFSISARNLDLQTPAEIAIREFDLNTPDVLDAAASDAISRSFADKPPTIVVDPGFVRGKDYEITYESMIEITGADEANTRSLVTAKGLDSIVANLQKVGTNEAFSAVGGINFAKGFGTQLPDGRMRWEVETKADGSVLVNGFAVVPPTATPEEPAERFPDAVEPPSAEPGAN